MAKPIVSTTLGAEGIEVTDGADILIADDAAAFAAAVERVLDERFLAARWGAGESAGGGAVLVGRGGAPTRGVLPGAHGGG